MSLLSCILPANLNREPSGEGNQAVVRACGGAAFLICLGALACVGLEDIVRPVVAPALMYFVFGFVWMWIVARDSFSSNLRKATTVCLDHLILAYGCYAGGEAYTLVVWAPIFASVGYGLRFGRHYARRSVLVGTPLLTVAMVFSEYWQAHWISALGLIASNVILPFYAIRLASNIQESKRAAEQRATSLEVLSQRDELTGVLNRRGFEHALAKYVSGGGSGFLMYIDLDNFKRVNDTCGHRVGDALLRAVAHILRRTLRGTDTIARLGGDEFVVILDGLEEGSCRIVADKIIEAVYSFSVPRCLGVRIGTSIGIVAWTADGARDVSALLEQADKEMYRAKRAGKNRICFETAATVSG